MKETIEILVEKAQNGDRRSLENLIVEIKDMVYNLSLRMLLHPANAEDATQEILVRIITHLSTFKNDSKFKVGLFGVPSPAFSDIVQQIEQAKQEKTHNK